MPKGSYSSKQRKLAAVGDLNTVSVSFVTNGDITAAL